MKPLYCVGNWKMNKGPAEAKAFCTELKKQVRPGEAPYLVVLPPAVSAPTVSESLIGSGVRWGAQNSYFETKGAFTGETSPAFLQEMGAAFCLVGHSERRQIFGEKDELLARKLSALQAVGVTPILCVGETLEERQKNRTQEIVLGQLQRGLALVNKDQSFWIAYEPVWAIGTGQVATVEQASEVHTMIRQSLRDSLGEGARAVPLLYGGSVKPDNASGFTKCPDVNGFLVGGASLKVEEFLQIFRLSNPS